MNIPLRRPASRGYSLAELLVVVAIIGILSLVSVPAFMNYRQSAKLKASMRQFVADIRASRARAITENHPTMISFRTGAGKITYRDFNGELQSDGTVNYAAMTPVSKYEKSLDPDVYFAASTSVCLFADTITSPSQTSGWNDIVFNANGTVSNVPTADECKENGVINGIAIIRIDKGNIQRRSYTFNVNPTGRIRVD
ncbi:MAG: pilus assembly FimT family protein [Thermoanaerobaculia bacterium]